jgi:hypothetical protein
MDGSVTRTTHQSFGSRLSNSCVSMLVGPLFVIVAIWLLVWNEGNAVTAHRSLDEGSKLTISLPTPDTIDPSYEGKLVHLIGRAETDVSLQDAVFGVTPSEKVLKLQRNAEMYQWAQHARTQTKKNTGGSTTTTTVYSYSKEWKSELVPSGNFENPTGHDNPYYMPYKADAFVADPITMGAFTLPYDLVNRMNWLVNLPDTLSVDTIPDDTLRDQAHLYSNNGYYIGNNPAVPELGDSRITYQVVQSQTISVVAQQLGTSFGSYATKAGKSILLIERGTHSAEEMYQHAHAAATTSAWLFRLMGFILVYIGLRMLMQPLTVAADVLPCLGNLVGGVTSCILVPIALIISLTVIALSWVAYRPFLAGSFLLAVAGLVYYRIRNKRSGTPVVAQAYVIGEMEEHDMELQPQNTFTQNAQAYVIGEMEEHDLELQPHNTFKENRFKD